MGAEPAGLVDVARVQAEAIKVELEGHGAIVQLREAD